MLKYEVKLGKNNFKQRELEWSEKYLAPDLSFISGVTDTAYHLEKFKALSTKSSIVNSDSLLSVESYNVIRQGFIVAKQKKYEIHTGSIYDYSINKEGEKIVYDYVKINGKYFYKNTVIDPDTSESREVFYIDNLLNYEEGRTDDDGNPMEICEYIEVEPDGGYIKVDTVYWIEDGKVLIDGNEYIYDKDEGDNGIIKFGDNGNSLEASAVTDCDEFEYHPYESSKDYQEVTKFSLGKQQEIIEKFSKISFCKYYYYIKYKNHYCQIKRNITGDSYKFVCEIPLYVVNGGVFDEYNLEPKEYDVYFADSSGNENPQDEYKKAKEAGNIIDDAHYAQHGIKLLDELKDVVAFVYVEEDKSYFKVEHDIVNANSGNEVAINMDNIYSPLKVGEKVELIDTSKDKHKSLVYNALSYKGKEDENFIFFNGKKYLVQENICDKVVINNNEYDIDYVGGKIAGVDCIVIIGGERVPMKIESEEGGDYQEGELKRYGRIMSGNSKTSVEAKYSIKQYDGILINGKKYIILNESVGDVELLYSYVDLPNRYTFVITEVIGNSLYVCKPFVNDTDFTDDFDRFISEEICKDVVDNQNVFDLQVKNKVLGEVEITEEIAFRNSKTPKSSSDFYDLFKDLKIYVDSGYIHIPLSLRMDVANNIQQEDIVTRDFFEAEKKKAINPIVDMEKDIYVPKFIYGYYKDNGDIHEYGDKEDKKYKGSKTIFKPIYDINLNFHFRTRDLTSWKVNDGYNQLRYSADTANESVDNWFITDFYPYRDILYNKLPDKNRGNKDRMSRKKWKERVDILQKTSDLMGLLYFTNDDIYFQRSKVAKSFARVSFYDSTDPQTQSLLATSCIFVDEHKLFKRYIDNSRKNLYEYGMVLEPKYQTEPTGFIKHNALADNKKTDITRLNKLNKISISTEFLGNKKENIEEFPENGRNGCPYSIPTAHSYNIIVDEDRRVSSRLEVDNRYVTDTSSEGFYVYIFREYAEKLHPKPIYMKIEFNHAGIGKMIPFLIPMHWSGNTTDSGKTGYNKMYPEHALMMSSTSANSITGLNDLEELKKGIPLSYTYAQTYIPLYAVYDFEKKEYGYVFDSRYVEQDSGGTLNLNLFEMKIANEEKTPTEKELKDIKRNLQERAIINVNEKQFNKNAFNILTE
jgi:hypothetical protein